MESHLERLTDLLLLKNDSLAHAQARTWVELLWSDFEATYARAGEKYQGAEMTEAIVRKWIEQYGPRLHEFVATNPKYQHLLNQDDYLKH
ncbi:hypothetical protein GKZ89_18955 [Bacillus mangrovi]|uniref:WVELL protein n=1 Tax=Metabacillus mangrovi TaxID=1491830 RepID=A0A7X2S8J8_9BACI|nr:YfhJ family protein [Metabacillus mangrovi]MTH55475.1 hypothetical protein [Metabacillus mangrovi]